MSEVIYKYTSDNGDFVLFVYSPSLKKPFKLYENTLKNRNPLNKDILDDKTILDKSPSTHIAPTANDAALLPIIKINHSTHLLHKPSFFKNKHYHIYEQSQEIQNPLFFDNCRYEFEWEFHSSDTKLFVVEAELHHKLRYVNECFRFNKRTQTFSGFVETENHIGWFHLPLKYKLSNGLVKEFDISFEVVSRKTNSPRDIAVMYEDIDQIYPFWRFSFAEKTTQSLSSSNKQKSYFPLLWLAHFQQLQDKFNNALNLVAASPHNRLQTKIRHIKAAKIKGKLNQKTTSKILNDLKNGISHKSYAIKEKKLSVDTSENQFIKMTVSKSLYTLNNLHHSLYQNERFSTALFTLLQNWQKPLNLMNNQPFMKQVGEFKGFTKESLVFHQRPGYSHAFQIWQELNYYLDSFNASTEISQKSIADIYEIWCFLTIRQCLLHLGFKETNLQLSNLVSKKDLSLNFKDNNYGAFSFEKNGIKIRLAHEPKFSVPTQKLRYSLFNLYSYAVEKKPDILLEITFQNNKNIILLFDAKYKIEERKNKKEEAYEQEVTQDYVTSEDIDKMHSYRDALIALDNDNLSPKTRPVFGVYALYPGFFDQTKPLECNPYYDAINEVGIGAFPLLPTHNGTLWLSNFLQRKLNENHLHEHLLVQHESRISNHGMQQSLYINLVLIMSIGVNRSEQYITDFNSGKLQWYHTPVTTFNLKFPDYIATEIRFLALAHQGKVERIYPIKSVTRLPRNTINLMQSGAINLNNYDEYYLFKLGSPLTLAHSIHNVPSFNNQGQGFSQSIKLTTLDLLENTTDFNKITPVYL